MKKKYLLQIGLAIVFLYAGISSLVHPSNWLGFLPVWITHFGVSREFALQAHGVFEILVGVLLLANQKIRFVALLATLDIGGIILVNGFSSNLFLITFRDIGLFFMALFLALD